MRFLGRIGFGLLSCLVFALVAGVLSYFAYRYWLELDPNTGTGFVMMLAFVLFTLKASWIGFFMGSRPHTLQRWKNYLETMFSDPKAEFWTPPEPFDSDNSR